MPALTITYSFIIGQHFTNSMIVSFSEVHGSSAVTEITFCWILSSTGPVQFLSSLFLYFNTSYFSAFMV
jgi:hypothetical protein